MYQIHAAINRRNSRIDGRMVGLSGNETAIPDYLYWQDSFRTCQTRIILAVGLT